MFLEHKATSDRIAVPQASIFPLNLIHPLLRSPLLLPTSAWHLLLEWASTLKLKQQVQMILEWLWVQTKEPANMINKLTSFDFMNDTIQTLQALLKGLPPPNPKAQSQPFGWKIPSVH